ncbi:MAG: TrkA family potassium uptake protein [Oscillospiraceae bacterium]
MNVLIVGAGKVGGRLAQVLESLGDEVSIVDEQEEKLALLENFSGLRVSGVAIDVDILKSAGIENCDAVAAVTNADNVNLMVAQIAQDIFKVPKVLCRVYDPKRKSIFGQNFSIATICPTSIAVDGVVSFLKFGIEPKNLMFGSTTATFKNVPVSEDMVGKNTDLVNQDDSFKIFGIVHGGEAFEFYNGEALPLEKGDSLVICELDK